MGRRRRKSGKECERAGGPGAEVSAKNGQRGREHAQRQKSVCGILCVMLSIVGCCSVLSHTSFFAFLGYYMWGMSNTNSRQKRSSEICRVLLCVTVCVMVYCGEGGFHNAKFRQQSFSKIWRRGENQTNTVSSSDGCWYKCFTASCDWSHDLYIEQRENVESCPLLDAATYTSIRRTQEELDVGPLFLTGDTSQSDFGRCSSSCLPPAAPPNASAMMGAGMLGAGSLCLVAGADEWLHASVRDAVTAEIKVTTGFMVESWMQIPHSCAAQDSFAFVLARSDYADAIRGNHMDTSAYAMLHVYPLFCWTAAPTE